MIEHAQALEQLRSFIVSEILGGEGEGLTAETPLLETGVIDSFSLGTIISFINSQFGCSILLEEVDADHLKNLDTLTTLVIGRSAKGPAAPVA